MKNRIIVVLVCVLLLIGMLPISAAATNTEDIVILYENDVHCSIEGYSKLSAMKKELMEITSTVREFPSFRTALSYLSATRYIKTKIWRQIFSRGYRTTAARAGQSLTASAFAE